jgi:DNA-binding FadR family transcriptional regulator
MFDADVLRWHAALKNPAHFLQELFEIRLIFEPAAAATVAALGRPEDPARLSALCDALAASRTRMDFAVTDLEFHKTILGMSGNRFLQSLGDLVHAALYSLFAAETADAGQPRSDEDLRHVVEQHRAIVAAIAEGAPDRAHAAMAQVIGAARSALAQGGPPR